MLENPEMKLSPELGRLFKGISQIATGMEKLAWQSQQNRKRNMMELFDR